MYFILTVFTTVGFGDMSAMTSGEIIYVCFIMAVGAVVHSIIISEVINVVTSIDNTNFFVKKQADLVEAFAAHTELEDSHLERLRRWVSSNAKYWVAHKYDKAEMRDLITSKLMPRELLGDMPAALFEGRLIGNR